MAEGRANRWLAIVGAVLALLFVAALFYVFTAFEKVTEVEEVGPHGLARVNPYLAAERTLSARGVPTTTTWDLQDEPDYDTTVFVFSQDAAERERLHDQLEDWLYYGGHLVVVGVSDPEDVFMEQVGVSLESTPIEVRSVRQEWIDALPAAYAEVQFSGSLDEGYVVPEMVWRAEDDTVLAMTFTWGDGWLTLLADDAPLKNDLLAGNQHASFLMDLGTTSAEALMVVRGGTEGLFGWIWRNGWMAVISLAGLIFVWILKAAPRFGPPIPDPAPIRRSLVEHIEAVGRYHWRQGQVEALVGPARRAALERLGRRHPEVVQLKGGDQVRWIAAHTGQSEELIREALFGHPRNAVLFEQIMRTLSGLGRQEQ